MPTTHPTIIDRSVEKTNVWLRDLCEELESQDRQYAYHVLRAFLHALRDRIPVDESAQLAAQLPVLIRGIYYEGWVPSHTPQTYHDLRAFLERVAAEAEPDGRDRGVVRGRRRGARSARARLDRRARGRHQRPAAGPCARSSPPRATALGCPTVPRVPSFLQRFRRVLAPPGRPAEAVGVPASGQELEGELGPVLEQLDSVGAQAAEIEARAHEQAGSRRDQAVREAAAILTEAQVRADGERARAAAQQQAAATARMQATRADAARESERIAAMRAERVEQLAAEVLECVRRSGR